MSRVVPTHSSFKTSPSFTALYSHVYLLKFPEWATHSSVSVHLKTLPPTSSAFAPHMPSPQRQVENTELGHHHFLRTFVHLSPLPFLCLLTGALGGVTSLCSHRALCVPLLRAHNSALSVYRPSCLHPIISGSSVVGTAYI